MKGISKSGKGSMNMNDDVKIFLEKLVEGATKSILEEQSKSLLELKKEIAELKDLLNGDRSKPNEEKPAVADMNPNGNWVNVVKSSIQATLPKWRFNLLLTVKPGSDAFQKNLVQKPNMLEVLKKFNAIELSDIVEVSRIYESDAKVRFLVRFKDLDTRSKIWNVRSRYGSNGIFIDCDLPLSLRTVRSEMLKELFTFSRRLNELNGSRLTFFKHDWGFLVLGRRFDFAFPGVVNKLRAFLIAHFKTVKDAFKAEEASSKTNTSDRGELPKSDGGDSVAAQGKLKSNEAVDSCRDEGDSIALRKQSRQKKRPDRYTPQKGDQDDDSGKGECCCDLPKCVACRPKIVLKTKILQSPEFNGEVDEVFLKVLSGEQEKIHKLGIHVDIDTDELHGKVKNARRQRIMRSSLDELKSEFIKLNLKW